MRPQVAQPTSIDERASKAPRLDPACEVEALRERVHALQLENEQLKEAAAAAELRAGAAELRAVAAEARAAEAWAAGARTAEAASATPMAEPAVSSLAQTTQTARPTCPSPPASTASSGVVSSDEGDQGANVGQPASHALQLARSLVRQAVRFQRTGIVALVESYDAVDGLHTVSANGRTWREALVGRGAVGFERLASAASPPAANAPTPSGDPTSQPSSCLLYTSPSPRD